MFLNHSQVCEYLPHRPPFLFIDTVEKILIPDGILEKDEVNSRDLVGTKVIANYKVKEDLTLFEGHFPGNPIFPGVIQIEMMAQASAFSALGLSKLDISKPISVNTVLLTVNNARFRKVVLPGMQLEVHATLVKCRGEVAIYECEVYSDGEKVSEVQVTAKLTIVKES